MQYKSLLVHLQLGQPNTGLLRIAGDLAERLGARIIGIAACQFAQITYGDGSASAGLIDQLREETDAEVRRAEREFRAALGRRAGAIEWRSTVTVGSLSGYLAEEARCADLIVTAIVPGDFLDVSRNTSISDLVMQAGRPVLIVPGTSESLALDRVVVAWNETPESRRAVFDALPLLRLASHVTVVEIASRENAAAAQLHLGDLVAWLKQHGIDADVVVSPSDGNDAARLDAIAHEHSADVVVAGAYGHSRLREFVLGGVTRDLLLRGKRCTLLSH